MTYDFDTMPDRLGTGSQKWEAVADRPGILPMSVADSEFVTPAFIMEAIEERADRGMFGYTVWPKSATPTVARWLEQRHGWVVPESDILLCNGVLTGLAAALRATLEPGQGVVINSPIYAPFATLVKANGFAPIDCPLVLDRGAYQFDFDALEQQLRREDVRCLILCNPHNPVARVYTVAELERLALLCLRHGVAIISDEIHADIVMPGHRHVPVASLTPETRLNTITLHSPSKTFNVAGIPGAAVICARGDWKTNVERCIQAVGNYLPTPFTTAVFEAAYRHGHDYADAQARYISDNHARLESRLADRSGIVPVLAQGTYLAWVDCRSTGLSEAAILDRLSSTAGIVAQEGSRFGASGTGFLRLNVACPAAVLETALQRLNAAFA